MESEKKKVLCEAGGDLEMECVQKRPCFEFCWQILSACIWYPAPGRSREQLPSAVDRCKHLKVWAKQFAGAFVHVRWKAFIFMQETRLWRSGICPVLGRTIFLGQICILKYDGQGLKLKKTCVLRIANLSELPCLQKLASFLIQSKARC